MARLDTKLDKCRTGLKICEQNNEFETTRYESLSKQWVKLQNRFYKAYQTFYNPTTEVQVS